MKHTLLSLFLPLTVFVAAAQDASKTVVPDVVVPEARAFPLSDLRLLEGSPFKHAMDKDGAWLLSLEPNRLLNRFHKNAGLPPKGAIYGGWETMDISGHTLGHYLSACSRMYAASGDERFRERVAYTVGELAVCQRARGTGYVGAMPNEDRIWKEVSAGDIRTEGFDLNGSWVPWYTLHKLWAGLIDAYRYAGNEQAKTVAVGLTDWAVASFSHLSDEQFQVMLRSEFGGMNESLAEMYALTGNEAYLALARKFHHRAVLDPMKEGRDELNGKHANTQIPKIVGEARIYELTGDAEERRIAGFFWDRVVNHHSYANGGNSNHELFGFPDRLNDRLGAFTTETCNTYNMLKITRHLFGWEAKAAYMDYYERALYNHILASQNPDDGMVCYCLPLGSGTEKIFSTPFDAFWCCVGTGLENHVKYAESVFFESVKDKGLFVNLFIPTLLDWKERGMEVRMETRFPAEPKITISFRGKAQRFPLHIRWPEWAAQGMKVTLNGREKAVDGVPGSYVTLNEKWSGRTTLTVEFPMGIHTVAMPDNPRRVAFFYGPVLLAAPLGEGEVQVYDIPCFVSENGSATDAVQPVSGEPLHFTARTTVDPQLPLVPFYGLHGRKHAVYFDLFTPQEWVVREQEYRAIIAAQQALEARTTDLFRIGEMQPERDHNLKSERSDAGNANGRAFRHAFDGWFSFEVKVDPRQPMQMICEFWGADCDKRNFDILIDGTLLRTVSLTGEHGPRFFEAVYDLPSALTQGRERITVCFRSHPGNYAGGLFGFRMVRKE